MELAAKDGERMLSSSRSSESESGSAEMDGTTNLFEDGLLRDVEGPGRDGDVVVL